MDTPTIVWRLRRDTDEMTCAVRLMPYGIEVELARNTHVVVTRVFADDAEAMTWADAKRASRQSEGWVDVPATHATPPRSLA